MDALPHHLAHINHAIYNTKEYKYNINLWDSSLRWMFESDGQERMDRNELRGGQHLGHRSHPRLQLLEAVKGTINGRRDTSHGWKV